MGDLLSSKLLPSKNSTNIPLKINDLDGEITYQWLLKHGKIGVAGSPTYPLPPGPNVLPPQKYGFGSRPY